MTTPNNTETAFGKIETCACCGKETKKPVLSKRLGCYLGKDCAADISHARRLIFMHGFEEARRLMMRDWPKSFGRLMQLAMLQAPPGKSVA